MPEPKIVALPNRQMTPTVHEGKQPGLLGRCGDTRRAWRCSRSDRARLVAMAERRTSQHIARRRQWRYW